MKTNIIFKYRSILAEIYLAVKFWLNWLRGILLCIYMSFIDMYVDMRQICLC